jgi:hypothetical protein
MKRDIVIRGILSPFIARVVALCRLVLQMISSADPDDESAVPVVEPAKSM